MRIVIATVKKWNIDNAFSFKERHNDIDVRIITAKSDLSSEFIKTLNPDYIFFPHWSWIIPEEIYSKNKCIVFHMTDLPQGRGGSPLQNQIQRGNYDTKISAIEVEEGLDTGDVYLKKSLSLHGGAEEIFIRASNVIFNEMIPEIINENIEPVPQFGESTFFSRRKESESELLPGYDLNKMFDHIRMLDADGYPKAYIEYGGYRLNFSRPKLTSGKIIADVEIVTIDSEREREDI